MALHYQELAREVLQELSLETGKDLMHLVDRFGPAVQLWPVGVPTDLWEPCTRLGGLPSVLPGDDWPMAESDNPKIGRFPLIFVAQLKLSDVAPLAADLLDLPSEGWLLFFVNERRLIQIEDSQPLCQVAWVHSNVCETRKKPPRVNLQRHCPFIEHTLIYMLNDPEDEAIRKLRREGKTDLWKKNMEELKMYIEKEYPSSRSEVPHYLPVTLAPNIGLSYPAIPWKGDDPFGIGCDLSKGIERITGQRLGIQRPTPIHEVNFRERCGGNFPRSRPIRFDTPCRVGGIPGAHNITGDTAQGSNVPSWSLSLPEAESKARYKDSLAGDPLVLLLQIPSQTALEGHDVFLEWNQLWGDAGNLNFFIRRSDLARRDFDNVVCLLDG